MASDSSDSPLVLTPESTGTSSGLNNDISLSLSSSPPGSPSTAGGTGGATAGASGESMTLQGTAKKTRRQTAFYPHTRATPDKPRHTNPFARSAAKRESVMALGSIEHLQHYFTKTGLVSKTTPLDKHPSLVPAIGGARARALPPIPASSSSSSSTTPSSTPSLAPLSLSAFTYNTSSNTSSTKVISTPSLPSLSLSFSALNDPAAPHELAFTLPPSPAAPAPPPPIFSPHVKNSEVDPESLLPGVIEDVGGVARVWGLPPYSMAAASSASASSGTADAAQAHVEGEDAVDILGVLQATTRAIRSTRNYLLALPDESAGTLRAQFRTGSGASGTGASAAVRPLGPRVAASAGGGAGAGVGAGEAGPGAGKSAPDPLVLIRRSALDVLGMLRRLEEATRLPSAEDGALSDTGDAHGLRAPSPPHTLVLERSSSSLGLGGTSELAFALVQVHGRPESIPVWEDEDDGFGPDPDDADDARALAGARRERWEARLRGSAAEGGGWLYRGDVRLGELEEERKVVGTWLDLVDEVLFAGGDRERGQAREGERGWERVRKKREGRATSRARAAKNRRASTMDEAVPPVPAVSAARRVSAGGVPSMLRGMSLSDEPEDMHAIREEEDGDAHGAWFAAGAVDEEDMLDDEDLPAWAKRSLFVGDELGRVHALIAHFLPPHLAAHLAPPVPRGPFLESLASGQLLCVAYNACVRKSRRPWGFVSWDGVHDVIALEQAAAAGGGASPSTSSTSTSTLPIAPATPDSRPHTPTPPQADAATTKTWTFRRTDNLRLWAGALKLRYMLPIQLPPAPAPSGVPARQPLAALIASSGAAPSAPSTPARPRTQTPAATPAGTPLPSPGFGPGARFAPQQGQSHSQVGLARADRAPPIVFDAGAIARKDESTRWDEMLEGVLCAWVARVVEERRVFEA
ncbi:hypothetical protein HYPSUDRAFT_47791 [Hypholoma sublateritium FD-334 SS-4]|uniref:Uncharacterized protein n=1 Tax=Hypholoma sublateritium (strain FD-334 SS-4) TaxID=945553 RepID=A0A0D2LYU3_HYPSF|nr:hypothetical protein HYPSUDRAFT_47791 [Hypholoma sublateritium FD-334 SS-4]